MVNKSTLGGGQTVDSFKDKERKYLDKIKTLKSENKKLVSLLRDSERLFY
jgi:hypothetical protein